MEGGAELLIERVVALAEGAHADDGPVCCGYRAAHAPGRGEVRSHGVDSEEAGRYANPDAAAVSHELGDAFPPGARACAHASAP
jgi:hypothetical protein